MMASQRILTVIDPTVDTQPALDRATALARSTGAVLELFICDYDQCLAGNLAGNLAAKAPEHLAGARFLDGASLQNARSTLLSQHQRRLETLADEVRASGLTVEYDVAWDHPLHEGIVRKAIASGASLVVKDTHYHPAVARSLFSNTDWNLIRACPVELLLVKPRPMAATPRVIAAVDPLHEHDKPAGLDHRILRSAANICAAMNGHLHVFHSFDPAPALAMSADSVTMPLAVPARELVDSIRTTHTRAVDQLVEEHGIRRDRVHVHQGPPHRVLIDLAEELQADLVVMGAVSRSGLKRLFLGSTAEQMLDRLPCDVLIVKPAGFAGESIGGSSHGQTAGNTTTSARTASMTRCAVSPPAAP